MREDRTLLDRKIEKLLHGFFVAPHPHVHSQPPLPFPFASAEAAQNEGLDCHSDMWQVDAFRQSATLGLI